jgi:hypothetical protein
VAGNLSGTYFFTKIANKTGESGDDGDQGKVSPTLSTSMSIYLVILVLSCKGIK